MQQRLVSLADQAAEDLERERLGQREGCSLGIEQLPRRE